MPKRLAPILVACLLLTAAAIVPAASASPDHRSRAVFVEGEDFATTSPQWTTGEGWADDIYSATSGNAVLGTANLTGEATHAVVIPETGTFAVWVRYLKINNGPGEFGLRIVQDGATVFDGTYHTNHEGTDWRPVWEQFPAHLHAGPATLTLYVAHPGVRQKFDCVLLTPELDYKPDYRDFAPQTFVRFRLPELLAPVLARVSTHLKRAPVYTFEPGWMSANGIGAAGPPVPAGEWSPWVDLSPYMDAGRWQTTATFAFQSEGKPLSHVKVDWQIGRAADAGTARAMQDDMDGPFSSLVLPGDMKRFPDVVKVASALSQEHYDHVAALGLTPMGDTHIPLETNVLGFGQFYGSERVLGLEMGAAHALGLNSFSDLIGAPNVVASGIGVHRGFLSRWFPYQLWSCPTATSNAKVADDHFAASARAISASDPGALGRHYRNILYDEPGTSNLQHMAKCASCRAGFVKYLKDRGFHVTDFGHAAWDEVAPIPRTEATDSAKRRLHYWSIQYRDYTNAMMVKLASDASRRHLGQDMLTMVNFTDEPINGWSSGLTNGPDWFLYGRLGSTTGLWSEDGASFGPEVSGLVVDMLRAAARPNHLAIGTYIVAGTPSILPQRAWSSLMHGSKMLHFYTWGPFYTFLDGAISDSEEVQRAVSRATHAIAKVDSFLAPAEVGRAEVAILWGKSHEIWQDEHAVGTERRAMYLACQQAHVPVDMVSEDDISDGLLLGYKVLYLAESNVTRAAARAIASWVQAGGVLQMSSGAGMNDEFNEPSGELLRLAGVAVRHVDKPLADYREHAGLPHTSSRGVVRLGATDYWRAASFPILGYSEESAVQGARALGAFSNGKPAATLHRVGRGAVLRFSFMPGMGYFTSAKSVPANAPITGYDPAQLEVLTAALKLGHVVSPLSVSDTMIEAQLLHGPKADVVMLANWSGRANPYVQVTIRGAAGVQSVTSSQGAAVARGEVGKDLVVTLNVDAVDALILEK